MKLTYSDLTSRDNCVKLSMVSFSTPQKNLEVYKFVCALRPLQEFFEIERSKILQKYGTDNGTGLYTITGTEKVKAYQDDLQKLLDIEIEENIPCPNLTENDFFSDNCSYPQDKNLWMNAHDIESVLAISKKLKS